MLGVPEEFGGIPADYVTQMLALMEVSKCGAPAFLITNGQCIHSMRRFGSAEQLRKTAESTLETGDPAYALALTEPGAGSENRKIPKKPSPCGGSTPVSPALRLTRCIKSAGICSAPAKSISTT